MLFSLIENLDKLKIILASASPRRYELLKTLGLEFEVIVSNIDEENVRAQSPAEYVLENAQLKGQNVARKNPNCLIISADTIVVSDNSIFGKPKNEEEAFKILKQLSGKTHQVFTAFGLLYLRYERSLFDTVSTEVTFRALSDEEIWAYINTGEPFDKAGAYAIQGQGALLIEKINGCFYNVVGFPMPRFYKALEEFMRHFVL